MFAPGGAFQFGWCDDWAYVGGAQIKLQVAHIKLLHSRASLMRGYLLQTQELLFDAHWLAFRFFEGAPGRKIHDRMKTADDKGLLDGKPTEQPDVTPPAAWSLTKGPEAKVAP